MVTMKVSEVLSRFISGLRPLAIPRLEDLPYLSSPPIQFVYESTATLALGVYTWNDVASNLTPNRRILANTLYLFRNITLTADISAMDYSMATVTTPAFYMFRQGDAKTVMFREPLLMPAFMSQFDYRLTWISQQDNDQLYAAFRGGLVQTANLVGKNSITLQAVVSAQEISDKNFVEAFRRNYPRIEGE